MKSKGPLEVAQQIANHGSPRTTKLYDRGQDEISLDEAERIPIWAPALPLRLRLCAQGEVNFSNQLDAQIAADSVCRAR